MGSSRNAGGPVDIQPHVIGRADVCFARVQAHAHTQLDPINPGMGGQVTLRLDDGLDRIGRQGESDKEGVSLGAHHAPMVGVPGRLQKLPVLRQQRGVFLA